MALFNTNTKEDFEARVIKSKKVVLVDFWAQWCPPCRAMAPVLEKIGSEMDSDVDVVKVDTEDSRDNLELATEYKVRSIPNMVVFKNGKVVDTVIGMVPKESLEATLKKHI